MLLKLRTSLFIAAATLLVAVGMALVGCGSGSTPTSARTAAMSTPSVEFMRSGGNDKPATFGVVAGERERGAASTILQKNLAARAAGEWAKQCATLSVAWIERVEADAPAVHAGKGCTNGLRGEAKPLAATKSVRLDTMTGPIAVLRIKGDRAFALYHGTKHRDYAMPMQKEGGEWKVAALVAQEVP